MAILQNEAQRAIAAARLVTSGNGRAPSGADLVTIPAAARKMNVSVASVRRARLVLKTATSEVIDALDTGSLSLNAAFYMAREPRPVQAAMTRAKRFVYFLRPAGQSSPTKIGNSVDPERRLSQYLLWSPVPLRIVCVFPGGRSTERRFHELFRAHWLHHEWFADAPEIDEVVAAIGQGQFDAASLPVTFGPWPPHQDVMRAGVTS